MRDQRRPLNRTLGIATTCAILLATITGCGSVTPSPSAPPATDAAQISAVATVKGTGPTDEQLALARTLIDRAAAANEDAKSEPGFVVMSTRAAAFPVVFQEPWMGAGNGPVLVVSIAGEFTTDAGDHPPQASASGPEQNSAMVLFVNPVSRQAEEIYIGSTAVELSTLGTQVPLP